MEQPTTQTKRIKKIAYKPILIAAAVILLGVVIALIYQGKAGETKISEFGVYQGYTPEAYDGSQRISEYLTLSDGTRLAYDLILPTKGGKSADKPLPTLFKYTPYGRAWTIFDKNGNSLLAGIVDLAWPTQVMLQLRYRVVPNGKGRLMDPLMRNRWLETMVKHGYAVVSVDRPGTGASFAGKTAASMETGIQYENEIINWIAAQPWSNGNVGMYGDSQQAMVQFLAASAGNPHLKAIFPAASWMDIYDSVEYPGGVFDKAFGKLYSEVVPKLDTLSTPVDSDPDGVLLAQARQERSSLVTPSVTGAAEQSPLRDSVDATGVRIWDGMALYPLIDRVNRSNTAVYLVVGWYDVFTADMFYWNANLTTPKRFTIRPTDHSSVDGTAADLDYAAEALRWFDYWLKGIDNGIMKEPPIHYYLQDGPKKGTWQTSVQWPPTTEKSIPYYFGPGKIGSVASVNGSGLVTASPTAVIAADAYTVNYSTTTGTRSRWVAIEETHDYPDLRTNDAKALTYTTSPLVSDLEVTGHPVVHLWLSTAAPDLDIFVYLEEVDPTGKSTYVTEGILRATHRKLSQAPFDNLGLPFHSHAQSDLEPIPAGRPFEMDFSLLPTAYRFHQGNSLRLTIAFADAGNFATPILDPAPTLQLLGDVAYPSYVEIPIIQRP